MNLKRSVLINTCTSAGLGINFATEAGDMTTTHQILYIGCQLSKSKQKINKKAQNFGVPFSLRHSNSPFERFCVVLFLVVAIWHKACQALTNFMLFPPLF